MAQLQDTDSGAEIYHMAETGLCEDGAQQSLIDAGETAPGGRLPVNTDGGCLANGEPVGASGLRQVRRHRAPAAGPGRCPPGGRGAAGRVHARLRGAGHQRVHRACRGNGVLLMSEPDGLAAWRGEVRGWLASVLPRRSEQPSAAADYAVFQNITESAERALLDRVREYRRERYDAGYGAIALPVELGGAGLSMRYVVAFTEEEQAFEPPQSTELISVTCGLVGPTIATFGTAEQRAKYARAFLRSDLLCCQLFSEPGAGSDLAAVATSAVLARVG